RFSFDPASPDVNTAISFDGSSSTSSNGALQARWDWEDNAVWDTTMSTTLSATHAFPSAGSYSVRLEVHDAGGLTGTVTHTVSVAASGSAGTPRSEEHTSELQSRGHLVCRLLLEKKKHQD